jgi:hypothetical protein
MDVTNRNLAQTLRMMAWERAKGELKSVLHTYWPSYYLDGSKLDEGFDKVNEKIEQFVQDVEDLIV